MHELLFKACDMFDALVGCWKEKVTEWHKKKVGNLIITAGVNKDKTKSMSIMEKMLSVHEQFI